MFQKDDDGNERLIAAVSRTYTRTERAYSIFKKEILALLYTLKTMDYFLRFADQLTILVDAKSIIYLRLAKDSSGILLRFSLELSKYNAEINHVSGEQNIISDVLSRHNDGIDDILEENLSNKPLTEKETLEILKKLTIPKEYSLTSEELKRLLEGPSPSQKSKLTTKKSKAITGKRKIKNTPTTLVNKKLNLPQLSMKRPGVVLPKRPRKKLTELNTLNLVENNIMTRNAGKRTIKYDELNDGILPSTSKVNEPETINPNLVQSNEKNNNKNRKKKKPNIEENQIKENEVNLNNDIENGQLNETNIENNDQLANKSQGSIATNLNKELNDDLFLELNIDEESTGKTINYTDVEKVVNIIHDGIISIRDFIKAQENDPFCIKIKNDANQKGFENTPYEIIQGILFKKTENNKKPVLPEKLIDVIINVKHYSLFGAHASPSRINREIKEHFFVPRNFLFKKLREFTKSCYICQLFNEELKGHYVSTLPKPNKPRISWSMDIISNMPETSLGYSQILLCVDDFSGFVICIPIKDSTSQSIITALRNFIFMPFGIPSSIRCDEQISFYNSSLFYTFMNNNNIKMYPTAQASPFSNSRAESSIKNIKKLARKFLFQENCIEKWDEYIPFLTTAHNSSIGIYGHSAEQIMFASSLPRAQDILTFDWALENEEEIVNKLFEKAEKIRSEATERMATKAEQNRTYKNSSRILKKFEVGQLVLCRQLQVSTGKGSDYKPRFTGPYVINSLNTDESTAFIEHIRNGSIIKAHFSNLQVLHYNPETLKYNHSLPEQLIYDLENNLNDPSKLKNKRKTT